MKHTGDYELDEINMLEQECADLEEENKRLEEENIKLKEEIKRLQKVLYTITWSRDDGEPDLYEDY